MLALLAVLVLLASLRPTSPSREVLVGKTGAVEQPRGPAPVDANASLAAGLLRAVRAADFASVVDYQFDKAGAPAPQVSAPPNVDVAVIRLDRHGRPSGAANVVYSRDFPRGRVVRLDDNLAATGIDWRAWDSARSDGNWKARFPPGSSLVPGVEGKVFMSPYPASTFKLLVAFNTLRLVDDGTISLRRTVRYGPLGASTCPGGQPTMVATTRELLDRTITYSDNTSACVLLEQIADLHENQALNRGFRALGLPTLQVTGIDGASGGMWSPGKITMTAMDTARLLLLVEGARGTLWTDPSGDPVRASAVLSRRSRSLLKSMLAQQGFHKVLSTTNWCGASYPQPGIPARMPRRWIDPADGTVTVAGFSFGRDVRPCNDEAEVTFAHKTGLTYDFVSDAGIVEALPGQDGRRYIVAVFANLGSRFGDPRRASSSKTPCRTPGMCSTEKMGILGRAIDDLMRRDA